MLAKENRKLFRLLWFVAVIFLMIAGITAHYLFDPWGFYWKVSREEADLRMTFVDTAERFLGCNEADRSHQRIIDAYNSHDPLPVGYVVQYTDSWCAVFVSAVADQCGLTDIIPMECGCERQIRLFQSLNAWEESDDAIPLPGDLVFYDWNMKEKGECSGWADHVGIIVGTKWPFIKVIEGNWNDRVAYRYLLVNDVQIRGFAKPHYGSIVEKKP